MCAEKKSDTWGKSVLHRCRTSYTMNIQCDNVTVNNVSAGSGLDRGGEVWRFDTLTAQHRLLAVV